MQLIVYVNYVDGLVGKYPFDKMSQTDYERNPFYGLNPPSSSGRFRMSLLLRLNF
jgi:hypothetical protein